MFDIALESDEVASMEIGGIFSCRNAHVSGKNRNELLGAFRVRLGTVDASRFQRHKIKFQLLGHADRGKHLEHRPSLIRRE